MMCATAPMEYLRNGWSVFPLESKNKPLVQWKLYQEELPTEAQVEAWWTQYPDAMVGLALGAVSNVVRIDADGEVPQEFLDRMESTLQFSTPSGGVGWLYSYQEHLPTNVLWKGNGKHQELRLQSDGAYTVIPPSHGYSWLNANAVVKSQWLLSEAAKRATMVLEREMHPAVRQPDPEDVIECLEHIPADDYDVWLKVGMALHSMGDELLPLWVRWSSVSCKFQEGECERKWSTFMRSPGGLSGRSLFYLAKLYGSWKSPKMYVPLDDTGNAMLLAQQHHPRVKHSEEWGWLTWDGRRWAKPDAEKVVQEYQKAQLQDRVDRAIASLAKVARDNATVRKAKQSAVAAIKYFRQEKCYRASRDLAKSDPLLSVRYELFDQKPWLLNCVNGTLDLETCVLREHDPKTMITQVCPTEYSRDAECPRWDQFMVEVFANDVELIQWLQKLLGYCLTGSVRDSVLPVLYGTGCNGKSTMVNVLLHVFGPDYAGTMPSNFLAASTQAKHYETVGLYAKRFAVDLETGDGMKLNEELVKRLTGGDKLKARNLYEKMWEFTPTHKLFLATNYEPAVRGQDVAIWRRMLKVPFTVDFTGRADQELLPKLQAEAKGILRWMMDGCRMWLKDGLNPLPSAIKTATEAYRGEQNTVAQFIEQMYVKDTASRLTKAAVTTVYSAWCQINKVQQLTPRAFGLAMQQCGVERDASNNYYHLKPL